MALPIELESGLTSLTGSLVSSMYFQKVSPIISRMVALSVRAKKYITILPVDVNGHQTHL